MALADNPPLPAAAYVIIPFPSLGSMVKRQKMALAIKIDWKSNFSFFFFSP